jgi:hypothetical protein
MIVVVVETIGIWGERNNEDYKANKDVHYIKCILTTPLIYELVLMDICTGYMRTCHGQLVYGDT